MFTKDLSFTHHEITSPSWLLALTALRKKNEDRKWAELVPLTVCEQSTKHQIACSTSKEQLCVIQESTPTFDLTPLCLSTIVTVQFLIFSCPQSTIPVTPECTAQGEKWETRHTSETTRWYCIKSGFLEVFMEVRAAVVSQPLCKLSQAASLAIGRSTYFCAYYYIVLDRQLSHTHSLTHSLS